MASYDFITSRGVIVPDTASLRTDVENEWKAAFGQDLVVTPGTTCGVRKSRTSEASLPAMRMPCAPWASLMEMVMNWIIPSATKSCFRSQFVPTIAPNA